MKKLIALVLLVSCASLVYCDTPIVSVGAGPSPVVAPIPPQSTIYAHIGPLNMTIPWDNVNVVYMYDLNGKRNLVGGEAGFATIWKFQATAGAVTSLDGKGAPFIGGNLWLPNPIPQLAILNYVQPGVFGGWDWTKGASIFGLKAAIPLFQ